MIFINFGRNSIAVIKAQYLVLDQGFNVSSNLLGYIVNMQSAALFIMGILVSKLARRFSDAALLLSGTIIAILNLLGFMLGQTLQIIFFSNFLAGVSEVIILAASYSYASKLIPPEHRGKQFALFNATFFLSWGVAGTLIAGPLVDLLIKSGSTQVFAYRMAFLSSTILVAIGIFILLFAFRIKKQYKNA